MTQRSILNTLEQAIAAAGLDFYLVPMADAFQSEYVPDCAARLKYLTGFTGSAGLGVFRAKPSADKKHALFVDGRYTLQAAKEVDAAAIECVNSGDVPLIDWLARQADGARIGFDPWLITQAQFDGWTKALPQLRFVAHVPNLVDSIWGNRPAAPSGEVTLHPHALAGKTYAEKRADILATLKKHRADAVLFTLADSINWLLNIRGDDVPFNPLLLAHLLLREDGAATLFIHPHKLSDEVVSYFAEYKIAVASLSEVMNEPSAIAREALPRRGRVGVGADLSTALNSAPLPTSPLRGEELPARLLIDPTATAVGWFTLAEKLGVEVVRADDPAQLPKATKNAAELAGIRTAHVRDGLALTRFLHWLDTQLLNNHFPDELRIVEKLEAFRAEAPEYRGPSFATIAGSGPNGAIVHYRADEKSNRKTRAGELLLLDSGGQYADGTTDVTRTVFIGGASGTAPAPKVKEHVTRVLKGHIALASARFPAGTSGVQLDVLARQYLWEVGLDFDHGTGHGVGAYLCVHEGPQRISKRGSSVALQPGMVLSNEPGYYETGHYGIRIENLVVVKNQESAARDAKSENEKPMLAFETLTLAPIDTRLIDVGMLSAHERNWLNAYHARIYKTHAPQLDDKAREWLMRATRAV